MLDQYSDTLCYMNEADFIAYVNYKLEPIVNYNYLKQQIREIIECLEFTHFDYSLVSRNEAFQSVISTVPEGLIKTYCEQELYKYDLRLKFIYHNDKNVFQSAVQDSSVMPPHNEEVIKANQAIRDLHSAYGFLDCYNASADVRDSDDKILLTVMSQNKNPEDFKEHVKAQASKLHYLMHATYSVTARKFGGDVPYKPLLTDMETQVMECLARFSKNQQQTAEWLGVSRSTVARHLKSAKAALGAKSTIRAVALSYIKAILMAGDVEERLEDFPGHLLDRDKIH